jgi:hypothetical protein
MLKNQPGVLTQSYCSATHISVWSFQHGVGKSVFFDQIAFFDRFWHFNLWKRIFLYKQDCHRAKNKQSKQAYLSC